MKQLDRHYGKLDKKRDKERKHTIRRQTINDVPVDGAHDCWDFEIGFKNRWKQKDSVEVV